MHQPVKDGLEDYLQSGRANAALRAHLEACAGCREAVARMKSQSGMFQALRAPRENEPAPGFYARVAGRIETEKRTPPAFWSLLLDPGFGKRLMYATMALLLLMSVYMLSTDPAGELIAAAPSAPEMILADETPAPPLVEDQEQDRDAVLVTLATFAE